MAIHDDAFFLPSRHTLAWPSIQQMFTEDTWGSTGSPVGTYRPLALLSIAADGAVYGNDLAGYHRTTVALHTLASVLVFALLVSLLGSGQVWIAALAAAIFAVHPIHTEAVDSVFNRSEVLATIGVVAALVVLQRWHERRPALAWTSAALLYFAALLCRESAATLPALAAVLIWLAHPGENVATRARRIVVAAVLAIPLAEYVMLRHFALAGAVQSTAPALGVAAGQDFLSRLLYSLATLREYARMLVWPWPLRVSYEDFAGGSLAATLAVHAILVAIAVTQYRRRPLATLAVAFFYIALLPSTRLLTSIGSTISVGDQALLQMQNSLLLGERVAYLPSVSLAIGIAVLLSMAAGRGGLAVACAIAAVPLLAGASVTLHRNQQWHSATGLYGAEVEAAPGNGDGWRLDVSALTAAGREADAAAACDRLIDRPSTSAQLFNNCGVVYDKLGRNEFAIKAYTRAIDLGLVAVGHANRGRVYARMGQAAEAEAEFTAAVDAETNPAQKHYRMGQMLQRFHPERSAEARREYQAALAIRPDYAAARQALAQLPR